MKLLLIAVFMMSSLMVYAHQQGTEHINQQIAVESHGYKEIHASELKEWYDHGKNMTVVDARTEKFFDGTLLPKAIWLPADAPKEDIKQKLPSKDALIVVYCWSPVCPAGKFLADRLVAEGYINVYKYPEGLQDWIKQGLPTTKK